MNFSAEARRLPVRGVTLALATDDGVRLDPAPGAEPAPRDPAPSAVRPPARPPRPQRRDSHLLRQDMTYDLFGS